MGIDPNIEHIAFHEAGHAVMALRSGFSFERVWIGEKDGVLGRLEFSRPYKMISKKRAETYIAGPIAQGMRTLGRNVADGKVATWLNRQYNTINPRFQPVGTVVNTGHFDEDYRAVARFLAWPDVYDPWKKHFRKFELQVIPIVRVQWPIIEAIAKHLLKRQHLTYVECTAIARSVRSVSL